MWIRKRGTSAAGSSTWDYLARQEESARERGFIPLRELYFHGLSPNGRDSVRVGTCRVRGFKRSCEKIYHSLWYKVRKDEVQDA